MATSRMHKTSWRSRRRSRLSVVERANPKPDAGLKTSTELQDQAALADEATAGDPSAEEETVTAQSDIETAEGSLSEALRPVLDDPEPQPAGGDEHAAAEEPAAGDPRGEEGPPSTAEPGLDQPAESSPQPARLSAVPQSAEARPAAAGPPQMAAPAGRDAAAPAAVPAVSPPQLRLNWPALTAAGYLDPDDLTAPLGQELARIGSILTRQTLSDQASWRDRIILVTSARPGEGKTFSAINFALELTRRKEHRITLVDADTIGAGATRRLGMQMEPGLTNALVDQRLPAAGIVTRTDLDRLSVVAAGPERDDVVDIFASRRMLQILRALTKDPRTLVVVDAPPILTRQETNVLSVIAGQVVLVVEAGRTTAEDVELALRRIGDRNNLALLLNRSGHAAQSKTASGRGLGGLNLGIDPGQAEPKRRLRKAAALALALLLLGIGATVAGELPGAALSACISCLPMLVWPAGS